MLPDMGWIEALKQSLDIFGAQVEPTHSGHPSSLPSHKVVLTDIYFYGLRRIIDVVVKAAAQRP